MDDIRIKEPPKWKPDRVPRIGEDVPEKIKRFYDIKDELDWVQEKNWWAEAFDLDNMGIINIGAKDKGQPVFELWRAMTEVDGYVCCTDSKRRVIRILNSELQSFRKESAKQTKAFMLVADPGSGKTYFTQCLAKSLGFKYLSFNLSQMLTKSDVLDRFDRIITTQYKQQENEPLLVVFDEIDAKIQGDYAFHIFLDPLEAGTYERGGKVFPFKPCVWVFIGTKSPTDIPDADGNGASKAKDFESRLTRQSLRFGPDAEEFRKRRSDIKSQKKIEQVYVVVSLLRKFFPDVQSISRKVVKGLVKLPDMEIRELKHFVTAFESIQYGKVVSKNFPLRWLQQVRTGQFPEKDFKKLEEEDMIQIV